MHTIGEPQYSGPASDEVTKTAMLHQKHVFSSGRYGQKAQGRPAHDQEDIPMMATQNNPYLSILLLVAAIHIPWIFFAAIVVVFLFLYHALPMILWFGILAGACWTIISAMGFWQRRAKQSMMICLLCFLAFPSGALAGMYNYQVNLMDYWSVLNYQEYTNVTPDEKAASHQDAGIIVFSKDAVVDITRPTAFTSGIDYCVAPIISNHIQTTTIEYWAVGKDCCNSRSGFLCDDSHFPGARAGIVVHNISATFVRDGQFYTAATRMAAENYGLTPGKNAIFVRWFYDIDGGMREYYWDAWRMWLWQILGFYFLFMGLGAFLFLGGLQVIDALDGNQDSDEAPLWVDRHDPRNSNDYGAA